MVKHSQHRKNKLKRAKNLTTYIFKKVIRKKSKHLNLIKKFDYLIKFIMTNDWKFWMSLVLLAICLPLLFLNIKVFVK